MHLHQIGNAEIPMGCSGSSGAPPDRKKLNEFLRIYDRQAKQGTFQSPRYRIPYTVMGDGPPLYIIQGIGSVRRLYACLCVELSKRFRVVIHDLAGTTEDGSRIAKYTLEDYTTDLMLLADHFGDDQFFVAGNSFGVSIAVRSIFTHPQRITRAILSGGFATRTLSFFEKGLLLLLTHWPGRARHIPILKAVNRYNHGRELDLREESLLEFVSSMTNDISLRTLARQVTHVGMTDLREILPKIETPLMVIHGESDRMVTPDHAVELANSPKDVRIMMIPDCGHLPQLSHPELYAHACEWFFLGAVTPGCPSLAGAQTCPSGGS